MREKGFSLIEVMMALAVLLLVVLPLVAIQGRGHRQLVTSKRYSIATSFMEREVERILSDTAPIQEHTYSDTSAGFEVEIRRAVENNMGTPQGHADDTGTLFAVRVRWTDVGDSPGRYPAGSPNVYRMETRHYRYHDAG